MKLTLLNEVVFCEIVFLAGRLVFTDSRTGRCLRVARGASLVNVMVSSF
jgi:hypothetical protein